MLPRLSHRRSVRVSEALPLMQQALSEAQQGQSDIPRRLPRPRQRDAVRAASKSAQFLRLRHACDMHAAAQRRACAL